MRTTMTRTMTALLGSLALFASACGETSDSTNQAESEVEGIPANAVQGDARILKVVTLPDGYELRFVELDPGDGSDGIISMEEQARANAAYSPTDEVAARALTALEAFRGFAGPNVTPPPELVKAHAAQARGLGRAAPEQVIDWTFVAPSDVPKSTAGCDTFVFAESTSTQVINRKAKDNLTTSTSLYTDLTTRNVTVGACNDSTKDISAWPAYKNADGSIFVTYPSSSVPANTYRRWYDWNRLAPPTCDRLVCTSPPLSYGVWALTAGTGNKYHLRTGELSPRAPR